MVYFKIPILHLIRVTEENQGTSSKIVCLKAGITFGVRLAILFSYLSLFPTKSLSVMKTIINL